MSPGVEIETLRRELRGLARRAEVGLVRRYALRHPPPRPLSLYRRMRRLAGRIVRRLGFRIEPWSPGLRHYECREDAATLLIWAIGTDQETLRVACLGFARQLADRREYLPVLVTDIADFAFFSRLGWLVEYVPSLSAPAGGYAERKLRYLAWRYRDALALPVAAGLTDGSIEAAGGTPK
jgi:hypothetical protein